MNTQKLDNAALTAFQVQTARTERALRHFDSQLHTTISNPKLSPASAEFLHRLWWETRKDDALSMANRQFRLALTQATVLTLLHCANREAYFSAGPRRLRMLSTCPSSGYSDFDRSFLRFGSVGEHFTRCMERRAYEGLGIIDLALIHNNENIAPSEIGIHFHAICCPSASDLADDDPAGSSAGSKGKNKYGLSVAQVDVRASPLTSSDVAALAYYSTKISCGLKQESAVTTYTSHAHWEHQHALRALEAYSYMPASSALYAVGPLGRELKAECEERLERLLNSNIDDQPVINNRRRRAAWRQVYRDLEFDEITAMRVAH